MTQDNEPSPQNSSSEVISNATSRLLGGVAAAVAGFHVAGPQGVLMGTVFSSIAEDLMRRARRHFQYPLMPEYWRWLEFQIPRPVRLGPAAFAKCFGTFFISAHRISIRGHGGSPISASQEE
jgi:hypothetical protein